jgi:hypothetical protein
MLSVFRNQSGKLAFDIGDFSPVPLDFYAGGENTTLICAQATSLICAILFIIESVYSILILVCRFLKYKKHVGELGPCCSSKESQKEIKK